MNQISRISRIHGLGVFRQFDWPPDLPHLGRYNLIYGWNGSGKTLLSRIFGCLRDGHSPQCEIILDMADHSSLREQDFGTSLQQGCVRVFNREFVDENVFGDQGPAGIVVLGATSIRMQEELEAATQEIEKRHAEREWGNAEAARLQQDLQALCTEGAREIRQNLRFPGGADKYANYERPDFAENAERMLAPAPEHRLEILEDDEYQRLSTFIKADRRLPVPPLQFSFSSSGSLILKAKQLATQSITSRVIDELRSRPDVNTWVAAGLELHRKHRTQSCMFCTQPLSPQRLAALEGHFSQQYSQFSQQIDAQIQAIEAERDKTDRLRLPDEAVFYPDMQAKFREQHSDLQKDVHQHLRLLDRVGQVLKEKKADPFRVRGDIPSPELGEDSVVRINETIREHNDRVQNHERDIQGAKERIEYSVLARTLPRYRDLKDQLRILEHRLGELDAEITNLEARRARLEDTIVEHRRPANELNQDLARYLGHDELQFDILDTGYKITRNGGPAVHLSDGERSALAFLYFLKSLEAKSFDLPEGIVVVDDPVSSLDSSALYYAFGFMKSRLKNAGQLFVLTHNFLFFRQVKDWFRYLHQKGETVGYYMLQVNNNEGNRCSSLSALDPLLRDYESEYHYLFSLAYKAAQARQENVGLEQYCYLPNVLRRLLEAFLEFKVPAKRLSIYGGLEEIDFDEAKKTRIRRFCDTHSHKKTIGEPDQDPTILGETSAIARDLMDLIKETDRNHFDGMVGLLAPASGAGAAL